MKNSRRSSTFFGKFMLLVVLVALGVISYGTYTYIQDSRQRADSVIASQKIVEVVEETEDDTETTDTEQTITTLNTQVVDRTKLNLIEATEVTPTTNPLTVRVMFSRFNEKTSAFSLAATFTNGVDGDLNSCVLTIRVNDQSIPQTVDVIQQPGITGCRFNNLDLSTLPAPTTTNPWLITLNGQNEAGRTLISLERSIATFTNLTNIK